MGFRRVYLDFEFNRVVEKNVNLVSCVTLDGNGKLLKWWLHKDKAEQKKLAEYLKTFDLCIAYAVVAEARSFLSLGLDPLSFKWIDDFLEYRMLSNHNDEIQYGKQLVDGKVRMTRKPRPKWQRDEGEKAAGFIQTHSLAEATYKITGKIRDTEHKTKIRDLIISDPKEFTKQERKWILEYNADDVIHLPELHEGIVAKILAKDPGLERATYFKEACWRGRYAAHTAIMESSGYPIDLEHAKNFSRQVENILFDLQKEINGFFPDIKPFYWNKREQRFSWDQKATKQWIRENHDEDRWMKTDGGKKGPDLSLALEAWERLYHFKHDYPSDNFGAQMLRFLKMKQSLYGFSMKKGGKDNKNFWDFVGSDGMVRPYMNIYGAQSSRSQPAAKGFMFLKPAWMRALVMPPKGQYMAGVDYGAQEFFAAALLSEDQNMIDAYLSGDPYFYQAKLSGAVPWEALRKDHEKLRDQFKATTLGISYLMSKFGLAIKLTADTGRQWTEDEAQEQIDTFYENFWKLADWQSELIENYGAGEGSSFIRLPDGWYMWGDNDNHRSVANVPVQGLGACAMRASVDLAVAKGVQIAFTLHDADYMIGKVGQEDQIEDLCEAMREGFARQFPKHMRDVARKIRLDPKIWGRDYKKDSEITLSSGRKVPATDIHIDKRALTDYLKFSAYFEASEYDL